MELSQRICLCLQYFIVWFLVGSLVFILYNCEYYFENPSIFYFSYSNQCNMHDNKCTLKRYSFVHRLHTYQEMSDMFIIQLFSTPYHTLYHTLCHTPYHTLCHTPYHTLCHTPYHTLH